MMPDRKKPVVAFWATVVVVVVLLYPVSFGPFLWLGTHGLLPQFMINAMMAFYYPIRWLHDAGNEHIREALDRSMRLWT